MTIDPEQIRMALARLNEIAEQFAEHGWTIPLFLDVAEAEELLEKDSEGDLDTRFINLYTSNGGAALDQLRKQLTDAGLLEPYRGVVRQALSAYDRAEYLIVVPALLAVLEGMLATVDKKLGVRGTNPQRFARSRQAQQADGSIHKVLWHSLAFFTEKLWQYASFSGDEPPRINRHWILHGRHMQNGSQTDALGLFQALGAVATLGDSVIAK